jgi:hypothetical protein
MFHRTQEGHARLADHPLQRTFFYYSLGLFQLSFSHGLFSSKHPNGKKIFKFMNLSGNMSVYINKRLSQGPSLAFFNVLIYKLHMLVLLFLSVQSAAAVVQQFE